MGQGVGVWIRSWGRVLECGLDHGGKVFGVWIRSLGRMWECGLDHGAGCGSVDEITGQGVGVCIKSREQGVGV